MTLNVSGECYFLKQKGKEVLCILEKFDLFLNSLNHENIICNVSMVKLLSEFIFFS